MGRRSEKSRGGRDESDGEGGKGRLRLRLRFGSLVEEEERAVGENKVGFGVAERVVALRKGGRYV